MLLTVRYERHANPFRALLTIAQTVPATKNHQNAQIRHTLNHWRERANVTTAGTESQHYSERGWLHVRS
jgi:hypothetical protein